MRNTRVSGHTLAGEGAAHDGAGCPAGQCPGGTAGQRTWSGNAGHAQCSCGEQSEHLPSRGQRQRWHAWHKAEIRAQQSGPAPGARYTSRDYQAQGIERVVELTHWHPVDRRWVARRVIDGQATGRVVHLKATTLASKFQRVTTPR